MQVNEFVQEYCKAKLYVWLLQNMAGFSTMLKCIQMTLKYFELKKPLYKIYHIGYFAVAA